ncbi:MAG: hypothetical protein RIR00_1291 [Pseudomonadota bacterium]|jgi:glycosyltransferase involved in cell wall biosynthesis
MRYLFVHQNFPGQFPHLAIALAERGHQVVALGDESNVKRRPDFHPKITRLGYRCEAGAGNQTHHYLRGLEAHVRRGQCVVRALQQLQKTGFTPDVVIAHPGWGEALFLRDVFPYARHIYYGEFFYRSQGSDVGFDPEFPSNTDDSLRVRVKNATQLLSLEAADLCISPTEWQRSTYPELLAAKMEVVHDGIDTGLITPRTAGEVRLLRPDGERLFRQSDEIVTYVSRNLEPYRGIHTFLRALPELLAARPHAQVFIVGGESVSYGRAAPDGQTWRQVYSREIQDKVDWSRVHVLGKIPYAHYLDLLRISTSHVYLTYPFVLSWSMLEAMAAGCLIIGSATPPVQEVLSHGDNGLLTDFFDPRALASTIADSLARRDQLQPLRQRARQTIQDRYDLHTRCLPRWLELVGAG